ncbi:GCD complex subunit gcd7 [Mycoemilia scoparia]|uniref:Translation initiation factor eIF2B subunit beta n=1 Tax=Mycoemilia scoparia TaxID=417184 RepID=A0A9W8DMU3_9FUNG|nr:GCD complex subunit gcd7 [Mycoemilia scoparia]
MQLERSLESNLGNLVAQIKRSRQITEAKDIGREATKLLRLVIKKYKVDNDEGEALSVDEYAEKLVEKIRYVGERLFRAQPTELILINVVNRVIHMIREESKQLQKNKYQDEPGVEVANADVKEIIDDALKEFTYEFEIDDDDDDVDDGSGMAGNFSGASDGSDPYKYIHSNEVIMTCGCSKTVEKFFRRAAKKRPFSVIIPEGAPFYHGHKMAKSLSNHGIEVAVVPDSAVFALMSQVNKVIIGTHTVMANGALVAPSGSQLVASAAKFHSIPVVVCAELYKFSPIFPFYEKSFNILVSPDSILPYKDGDLASHIDVINPYYDYVAPELIDVFVDQTGGHPPSYLYRLLQESYDTKNIISAGNNQ